MNAPTESDDLTPVIYPFGRGEKVRITDMTEPDERVASRVELSSGVMLEWMRGNSSGSE
jgi:hypothetical protein